MAKKEKKKNEKQKQNNKRDTSRFYLIKGWDNLFQYPQKDCQSSIVGVWYVRVVNICLIIYMTTVTTFV